MSFLILLHMCPQSGGYTSSSALTQPTRHLRSRAVARIPLSASSIMWRGTPSFRTTRRRRTSCRCCKSCGCGNGCGCWSGGGCGSWSGGGCWSGGGGVGVGVGGGIHIHLHMYSYFFAGHDVALRIIALQELAQRPPAAVRRTRYSVYLLY
jgi:hypothetical protein